MPEAVAVVCILMVRRVLEMEVLEEEVLEALTRQEQTEQMDSAVVVEEVLMAISLAMVAMA